MAPDCGSYCACFCRGASVGPTKSPTSRPIVSRREGRCRQRGSAGLPGLALRVGDGANVGHRLVVVTDAECRLWECSATGGQVMPPSSAPWARRHSSLPLSPLTDMRHSCTRVLAGPPGRAVDPHGYPGCDQREHLARVVRVLLDLHRTLFLSKARPYTTALRASFARVAATQGMPAPPPLALECRRRQGLAAALGLIRAGSRCPELLFHLDLK